MRNPPINWDRWIIFAGLSFFIMIVNFDMTTINLALVQISSDFDASISSLGWILNGYYITLAISFVIAGRLSDRYGETFVFRTGCLFLVMGSLVSGTSSSIPSLVAGRFLQGIGAGFGFSVAMLIVTQQFPKSQRGKAVACTVTLGGLAQGVGPLIAAHLIRQFGWHSLFISVAGMGVFALLFTLRSLKSEPNPERRQEPFDFVGAVLFVFGVMGLLVALNMLQSWSTHHLYLPTIAIGGGVLILLLIRHIRETKYPLIRADLRANSSFLCVVIVRIIAMAVWSAFLFMLPHYLQHVRAMSVTSVGHILLFMTLTFGLVSPFNGIWMDRIGSKLPCQVAMIISTLAFVVLACMEIWQSDLLLYLGLFLFGLHSALIVSASIHAAISTLPKKSQGSGMGLFYTISFSGATLGVVFSSAILSYVQAEQLSIHVSTETIREISHYAIAQGFVKIMSVCAGLSLIGFLFTQGFKVEAES
jgi:MFS family permease